MGRKVKSQFEDNISKGTIDVSNFAAGAYILRIVNEDETSMTFNAIKQ